MAGGPGCAISANVNSLSVDEWPYSLWMEVSECCACIASQVSAASAPLGSKCTIVDLSTQVTIPGADAVVGDRYDEDDKIQDKH